MRNIIPIPIFAKKRRRVEFETRVEQQLPSLVRLARGLTGNQPDAEDLVHDACVKALNAFGTTEFETDISLRAWLKRILVNTYRDQYRRTQRSPIRQPDYHATSDGSLNVLELVASTEQSPVERMQSRDSSSAIQHAISTLPPEVRVVSLLFLVNELSYKEIAFITDCPIGTVMSRLSRGRQKLRQLLSEFHPDEGSSSVTATERSHGK
jgi:RNA polymerase sigma-70 factor (ECF subfamily)